MRYWTQKHVFGVILATRKRHRKSQPAHRGRSLVNPHAEFEALGPRLGLSKTILWKITSLLILVMTLGITTMRKNLHPHKSLDSVTSEIHAQKSIEWTAWKIRHHIQYEFYLNSLFCVHGLISPPRETISWNSSLECCSCRIGEHVVLLCTIRFSRKYRQCNGENHKFEGKFSIPEV